MKLIDRILLAIYSLFIAMLSLLLMLVPLNVRVYNWTSHFFESYRLNVQNLIIPIFFLTASIRFLISGIRSNHIKSHSVVKYTSFGEVKIAIQAIEGMAQKSARAVHGLRDIKATAKQIDDGLVIDIRAFALTDINIPEVAVNIQKNIKEHIEEYTGILVKEVKVAIDDIAIQSKGRVE